MMEQMLKAMTSDAGSREPAILVLTVVNPADSARFEISASPDTTPGEIIEGLIEQGLLPASSAGRGYTLSIHGGSQLHEHEGLGAGGVTSGATLQLWTTAPGAGSQKRTRMLRALGCESASS